jgi:uncharacterized Zn-binding protein involved in type VI secretion
MDEEGRAPGRTRPDEPGLGRARLYIAQGGEVLVDRDDDGTLHVEQVVQLEAEVGPRTTVGGDDADDLRLAGLDPATIVVTLDEARDEYVVTTRSDAVTVNGAPVGAEGRDLHTGDVVVLGPWTLSFARDEFADHGRPHGGRQGGEFSVQEPEEPT